MTLAEQTDPEDREPSFDDLDLTDEVRKALTDIDYREPTPVQLAAYGPAVEGRDIIVQAQTGTGKTAAFGIPLVDRIVTSEPGVQALILAPTRELALQSTREIQRLGKYQGVRTVAVYGGAPMQPQIKDLAEGAQIVSGTPGRVLDHLRRGTLDASGLKALVLDEMDEMLSMGFAKELNAILDIIPSKDDRQTMCFSATVDSSVQRHAQTHMSEPLLVSLSSDAVGASEITHYVYMVSGTDRTGDLIQVLNAEDPESAIVFCNMRSETEKVATQLQAAGFNADWLNGDLPQRDRERIMGRTREGKLRYLVATDVAARGIDISHLTHVINYSFPESAATYVHRTGRTGRAGRTGCALSLVAPQELGRLYYLRLEYGISPVERSLPSSGEMKTRMELDRIKLLEASASGPISTEDLDLARRLLSHPEAERIVGGLLHAVFGDREGVSDEAADARRNRSATPVEPPRARRRRGRAEDRGEAEVADARRKRRHTRDDDDRQTKRRARRDADAVAASAEAGAAQPKDRTPDTEQEGGDDAAERKRSARRGSRRRRKTKTEGAAAKPGEALETVTEDTGESPAVEEVDGASDPRSVPQEYEETGATIFLNVGRKDGARVGELAKLMRELGQLPRSEVGKIRVRDRYTFVDVPEEQLDAVVERLRDGEFNRRALEPERAKVSKS